MADAYDATEKLLGSPNVGLLGYLVISGTTIIQLAASYLC